MKKLFGDDVNEKWTPEALAYEEEVSRVLRPIFEKALKAGHSLRDLQHVILSSSTEICLETLVFWEASQSTEITTQG